MPVCFGTSATISSLYAGSCRGHWRACVIHETHINILIAGLWYMWNVFQWLEPIRSWSDPDETVLWSPAPNYAMFGRVPLCTMKLRNYPNRQIPTVVGVFGPNSSCSRATGRAIERCVTDQCSSARPLWTLALFGILVVGSLRSPSVLPGPISSLENGSKYFSTCFFVVRFSLR